MPPCLLASLPPYLLQTSAPLFSLPFPFSLLLCSKFRCSLTIDQIKLSENLETEIERKPQSTNHRQIQQQHQRPSSRVPSAASYAPITISDSFNICIIAVAFARSTKPLAVEAVPLLQPCCADTSRLHARFDSAANRNQPQSDCMLRRLEDSTFYSSRALRSAAGSFAG